ncbi:MAG TPA: hypothetical protein VHL53_21395 [Acidimicrobiia bacterium]|nr:hypothetical protein [Acidimicrobiia bacterium]
MTAVAEPSARHRRPVEVERRVPFPASAVRALIAADPAGVLSALPGSGPDGGVPLGVRLVRNVRLQREVTVGFGPFIEEDDGTVILALWWEAAHQPWLFPTFDGGLEISARGSGADLRLVGSYQLPLGQVGVFADEILGRRAARSSLEAFLAEIAATVTARLRTTGPPSDHATDPG